MASAGQDATGPGRFPQQRPPGPPGQEATAPVPPRRARCRRAGPIPCKTPPHPRPPGRPCGLSISRKATAGRGKMPGKTTPATGPPRRGCQSVRATLSTTAATGDTAAGNPQPPAGGCQSGTATATDSGPIPSATATRATGETAAGPRVAKLQKLTTFAISNSNRPRFLRVCKIDICLSYGAGITEKPPARLRVDNLRERLFLGLYVKSYDEIAVIDLYSYLCRDYH